MAFRMSRKERLEIERNAAEQGLSPSDYLRRVLFPETRHPDLVTVLIAELRAMRSILFQLLTAKLTGQPITDDQIRQIVKAADEGKYDRAEESLKQLAHAKKDTVQ